MDYETSESNLKELIGWASSQPDDVGRNEATTRLQFINRLLTDCLGWAIGDITAEDREQKTYADYVLGSPAKQAVVEAKREGDYFELPIDSGRNSFPIASLAKEANVESALNQAMGYCLERGIPIGAICNGHQLIAFLGSRQDGIPPKKGRALVFGSLEEMETRFRELWNALSPEGVETRGLYRLLESDSLPTPPAKLSARLIDYPGFQRRNELQTELGILGDLFMEGITHADELQDAFLAETYCSSGALSQYALVSKEILRTRYSSLMGDKAGLSVEPIRTRSGLSPELMRDVLAAGLGKRPIVLLGDVGVGKTMFIQHLIHVEAKDLFDDAISLYIDFGEEPALPAELSDYVQGSLARQLFDSHDIDIFERQFVRGVYNLQLEGFKKSIFADLRDIDPPAYKKAEIEFLKERIGDSELHLRESLGHITRARKKQVVIFLDNIDQRNAEFQDQVFVMAQSFAGKWPATVFVSLRPDTFYRSREEGSLAAYQPRAFTISPPRIDLVIEKRIDFALGSLRDTHRLGLLPEGIELESETLNTYLQIVKRSFSRNRSLAEFLDNASAGNVRRAIDFVTAFIGSGHVNTRKILEIESDSSGYVVPVHEFLRAVLFGDHRYYDPISSPIPNLFDIGRPDPSEHFLLPTILAAVERGDEGGSSEGFVSSTVVFSTCQALGFLPEQVNAAMHRAVSKRLLQDAPPRGSAEVAYHRLTTLGAYAFKKLLGLFTYVDAILVDTPILSEVYEPLVAVDVSQIEDRLERAENFRAYLDTVWRDSVVHDGPFQWSTISDELGRDIVGIARRVTSRG